MGGRDQVQSSSKLGTAITHLIGTARWIKRDGLSAIPTIMSQGCTDRATRCIACRWPSVAHTRHLAGRSAKRSTGLPPSMLLDGSRSPIISSLLASIVEQHISCVTLTKHGLVGWCKAIDWFPTSLAIKK